MGHNKKKLQLECTMFAQNESQDLYLVGGSA